VRQYQQQSQACQHVDNARKLPGWLACGLPTTLTKSLQHQHPLHPDELQYRDVAHQPARPAWGLWRLKHSYFETRLEYVPLNIPVKYTIITTFNEAGYNQYGQRMIDTFAQTWPTTVTLRVYAEGCKHLVNCTQPNIEVYDLEESSPGLVQFKQTWGTVP
jgi:hypothetical protein